MKKLAIPPAKSKELATTKPPMVPAVIDEEIEIVSDDEALTIMRDLGLVKVSSSTVTSLARLGVYLRGAGAMKYQRGGALVNQQRVDEAMRILIEKMYEQGEGDGKLNKDAIRNLTALAAKVSLLSRAKTESQHLSVEIEGLVSHSGGGAVEEPESTKKSFEPGAKIFANNVYLTESKPPETPAEEKPAQPAPVK